MSRRVEVDGTVHEFPDDATDVEIQSALGGAPADATAMTRFGQARPNFNATILPELKRGGVRMLPAAVSMAGGLGGLALGGPVGAGLGTVGGEKVGEWLKYAIAPSVGLPQEMPGMLGLGDVPNFVLGAAGPVAESMARPAARGLMHHALDPTARELQRFPNMVEAALTRGERVGAPGAAQRAGISSAALAAERSGQMAGARAEQKRLLGEAEEVLGQRAGSERAAATASSKGLVRSSKEEFTLKDLAAKHVDVVRADKGGALSHDEIIDATLKVQDAIRALGLRAKPKYSAGEVDRIRRLAGKRYRGVFENPGATPTGANDIDLNLATGARELLGSRISGLRAARSLESRKIKLSDAAKTGNEKRVARIGRRGDITAQEYGGMTQIAREGPRQRLSMLRAGPASPVEQEALLSNRLLGAAQNRLPWHENFGTPVLAGGAAYAAGHNPLIAALSAGAARFAMSPRVQSQTALALDNPIVQQLLRYGPLAGSLPAKMMFLPPDETP